MQFVSTSSVAGTLTRANGSAVSGRTVKLVNSSSQIVATTTTASNGTYSFSAVAPGTYSIQFEGSGSYKAKAKSGTGSNQGNVVSSVTVGSSSTITGVDAVVIDPAGVIYDSTSRAPLANAVASLWYNNAKVNNSQLDTGLGGANDQTTGSDGSYSFVLNSSASSGTYEIRVVAPSGYTGTPSSNIPASGTYTPSLGGGLESIQSQSTAPTGLQPTTYYLLFNFTIGSNAAGTSNGVINNHIPLDPIIAAPVFTNTNATDGSNNPSYSFTYDENRAAGATLGTVSATGTGSLSYAITAGNGSSWFAIDATTGVITMTQAGATSLANDYETVANVQTLTVQVSDGTRTTTIEVKLNERNLDDTAPVITGPSGGAGATASAISVNENQTGVTTLTADESVTWSLVGGEDQVKFAINPTTGVLTFIAAPDFEAPTDGTTSGSNTYIVQVKALDASGNFSLQTITVTVLDVNEVAAPVFTNTNATDGSNNPSYSFTYDENRAAGATLGTVSATGTGSLSYAITAGNGSSWFAIDATTGVITMTQAGATSLANDYETVANVQTLTVQVSDGTRTTTIEVKLNERNLDDTAPVITGPSGGAGATASAISVNEGLTLATTLATNEAVTWSIIGGADQARFVINPATGALSFITAPNYETPTDADQNNSYVVQVRALDANGNFAVQTVTITVINVDEIARKLAQVADPLRNSLRSYVARSLGDMLSFNEQLLGDDDAGQCNAQKGKPVSGGFNANNQAQSARLNFAQKKEDCERRYRVYLNGAIAVSRLHGDWMTRTMASARIETDLNPTLVVGAGVLTTFADDKIRGFASSDISDTSVQLNLYGRKRLTDVLRMAAFAGYGKAWYDFGLTDNGFAMTGKMTGDRFTYGATLTGDIVIGETPITTDVIISRATEKLGAASLNATYLGEARSGIGFHIGNVDMTRLSVPVHLPIDFQKSAYEGGNAARLEFSPGLLCEDQSADASTLSCGFKADAKLTFTHGIRSRAYLDASFETVSGMERYMAGMGFGYRFGPKNALEVGMSLNGGTTGLRQEARALLQIRVAQ